VKNVVKNRIIPIMYGKTWLSLSLGRGIKGEGIKYFISTPHPSYGHLLPREKGDVRRKF
jgi:hypothetical protein